MALVEIEAGPHRITAAITRDAVEELGLAPGRERDRDREGDLGDGRALVRRTLRGRALVLRARARRLRRRTTTQPTLRVSAAASLKNAFEDYGASFDDADVSFSFAGLRRAGGADPQGRAPGRVRGGQHEAARTSSTRRAWSSKPVPFAANRLVLAVPADGSDVSSLGDLDNAGVRIAAGSRERAGRLLHARGAGQARLGAGARRSSATSAPTSPTSRASSARSRRARSTPASSTSRTCGPRAVACAAIELPARLQPLVVYGAAVVKGTDHRSEAQAFVDGLLER